MTTLEKVTQLKNEGIKENEIISNLKNQGISPMEINDALNQSKIKEAINDPQGSIDEKGSTKGMTPSIMGTEEKAALPVGDTYTPAPAPAVQEQYASSPAPTQDESYAAYIPQEGTQEPTSTEYGGEKYYEETPQEDYAPETYNQEGYSMNSDTMIEVAEQVFSEKMKKLNETIKSLIEFKTIFESRVEDINQRLKRMETQFDKMQIAILDRVGSFGKNLDKLEKEVNMVEDSFSKMNSKL